MSEIKINHLTFSYEGSPETVFEDVNISIDTDWKLGLIGRNGRGKTTLLKLLCGELLPDRGSIACAAGFAYFPYPVKPEDGEQTALMLCGQWNADYEYWKLVRELKLLGIAEPEDFLLRPFGILSKGEQTKLMLAALFTREHGFLLIDEPTDHLDAKGREILGEYLSGKKGFILVSHDRKLLDACTEHVLSINRSDIELVKGNFSSWHENKKRRDAAEQLENKRLHKEIKRLSVSARRAAQWSDRVERTKNGTRIGGLKPDKGHIGHMAAKAMKRAKSIESRKLEAIGEKKGLLKNIETAETLKLYPLRHHKEVLIRFRDAALAYGEKTIAEGITFELRNGEKLALSGENGCGKSSVLKLILKDASGAGTAPQLIRGIKEQAEGLVVSYVPQDAGFLCGRLNDYIEMRGADQTIFLSLLRKFGLPREQFEAPLERYSSGQKKLVLLAASLCEQAHLYLWDEPLNYIDIFARMQIEEVLRKNEFSMIFVEHDRQFTENIAAKIVTFS